MTPDRWHLMKSLFNQALDYPPYKRQMWLEETCPDVELRDEVLSLLAIEGLPEGIPPEKGDRPSNPGTAHVNFSLNLPLLVNQKTSNPEEQSRQPFLLDPAPPFPIQDWDRYEIIRELGMGGMGTVFLARDLTLNRQAALKFLRKQGPQGVQRLVKEARAQARITHEGVCKIFEVGEVAGLSYIAMEYIQGQTLTKAHKTMTLEEKVETVRRVAEALHEAHRLGIIHRDIKPHNIMIEQNEDGKSRVIVTDFGVAREIDSTDKLTETGMIVGTPSYMSPEQAQGNLLQIDRRSDVYGLGAILYEMLTGRPPFHSPNPMETLLNVIHNEPVSVCTCAPHIPQALEIITMKCLEKEPSLRYESARAMAFDLERFLDGEPITALKVSWLNRLWRKAKKNKIVTATVMFVVLVVTGAGLFSLHTQWQAHRKVQLIQHFTTEAEQVEALLRFAYLSPIHDIRPERAQIRQRLELMSQQMSQHGSIADGPGNYALGRGYLALHEFKQAKDHLEKAYQSGFRIPELDLAMGRVLGEVFRAELEQTSKGDAESRTKRKSELENLYIVPALQHLKAYSQTQAGHPTPVVTLVEGILAYYRKNYPEALIQAQKAASQSAWLYEAHQLIGDIHTATGLNHEANGEIQLAVKAYQEADDAYQMASKIGRSDDLSYQIQATFYAQAMENSLYRGNDQETSQQDLLEKTIAACDLGLQCNPENSACYCMKGYAYINWATFATYRPQIKDLQTLQRIVEFGELALKYDARNLFAYDITAWGWCFLARYQNQLNQDPLPNIEKAIAVINEALRIDPNYRIGLTDVGYFLNLKSGFQHNVGVSPTETCQRAVQHLEKALQIEPNEKWTLLYLIDSFSTLGIDEWNHHQDPRRYLDKALQYGLLASRNYPNDSLPGYRLSQVYLMNAVLELEEGLNPTDNLRQAHHYAEESFKIFPDPTRISRLYSIEIQKARWATIQGKNPTSFFEQAERYLRDCRQMDHNRITLDYLTTELCWRQTEWKLKQHQIPGRLIQRGLSLLKDILKSYPQFAEAYARQGTLFLLKAKSVSSAESKQFLARQAVASFERGLQMSSMLKREFEPMLNEARQIAR